MAQRQAQQYPQGQTPNPAPQAPDKHRYSLVGDVYNGAVHGDFAPELGLAGITTQVICGFLPGIGTACALRDYLACQRAHDRVGMLLNGLSLVPFLGGVPKVAEVARGARLYAEGLHAVHAIHHHRRQSRASDTASQPAAPRQHNPAAVFSLLLGLAIPILAPLLALAFAGWVAPWLNLGVARQLAIIALICFAVPLLTVIAGHAGRHRARVQHGYGSGRGIAAVGLVLGYLYLVAFAGIVVIFLAVMRPNLTQFFA